MIKALKQYKGDDFIKPHHINDGIYYAITNGYLDQLKYMVEIGGDLNIIYPQGDNTVMMAVQNANVEVLNYLIEQGVNLNHQMPDGTTPLMSAVIFGDKAISKLLLEHSADVSLKDTYGKSAMDYAKEEDDEEMIELLQSYAK
jgi:ankyrin repeat protein